MKLIRICLRGLLILAIFPVSYVLLALLLTFITVNEEPSNSEAVTEIYLSTNGVHLDIVMSVDDVPETLRSSFNLSTDIKYTSFGWGDENFYINTPTWDDLTFSNAFRALFLQSSTLMHVTEYREVYPGWCSIPVNARQLSALQHELVSSYSKNDAGEIVIIEEAGYTNSDSFYKAEGSYSCFNTCNTWVNSSFKASGLKAAYWTPFDFGLLMKYE